MKYGDQNNNFYNKLNRVAVIVVLSYMFACVSASNKYVSLDIVSKSLGKPLSKPDLISFFISGVSGGKTFRILNYFEVASMESFQCITKDELMTVE